MPIVDIRSQALAAFTSEHSIEIDRLPCALATVLVVPLPANGSNTKSPSLEQARITRSK